MMTSSHRCRTRVHGRSRCASSSTARRNGPRSSAEGAQASWRQPHDRRCFSLRDRPTQGVVLARLQGGTAMRLSPHRVARILFLLLLAGSTFSTARASEDCPASVLTYAFKFQSSYAYVPAAAFDTSIVNADGDTSRVDFDRAAAHIG